MNHAKPSFSTEICAGAMIRVVQCSVLLRYVEHTRLVGKDELAATPEIFAGQRELRGTCP
jgi:hypothetical protein